VSGVARTPLPLTFNERNCQYQFFSTIVKRKVLSQMLYLIAVATSVAIIVCGLFFRWVVSTPAASKRDPANTNASKTSRNKKSQEPVQIEYEDAALAKTVVDEKVEPNSAPLVPISVNYHFTRVCNYSCGFCFHTAKTSYVETLEEAKRGIKLLHDAGMIKINFAGGEPFLKPALLGQMVRFCKSLDIKEKPLAVSIVSNGSKITEKWLEEFGQFVDVLAISCDSFDEAINKKVGRTAGGSANHSGKLWKVRDWCSTYGIKFKINTVVNAFNWEEDMNAQIAALAPTRWKVFQCLILEGENDGNGTERNANRFLVTNEQFKAFCKRHEDQKCLVPEDNDHMKTSYLILDEYMRFLDCSGNGKTASASILVEGVQVALKQSGFDQELFHKRGGIYDFTRETSSSSGSGGGCALPKELEF
jgi:radical S-adenosyl methionine domain-containing protein 2